MTKVDVAICGAGPVGLTAAALLAARGVRVAVLERNAGTSDAPKAISIDDESLRVYQWAGLAAAVLGVVAPGTGTRYYDSQGACVLHARPAVPLRHGYPFKNPFAQPELEAALRDALEANPLVDLRFGTEVTAIRESGDTVAVSTTRQDELEASYLLGCDGGRSTVRAALGIPMSGRSFSDSWLVVDMLDDPHEERFAMHYGTPERPHVIVPGLGGRCRYEFRLFPGEAEPGQDPPLELIERLVTRHGGRRVRREQVERAVVYRFHAVLADRWMRGRAILLGDAAHMMPPFAGQGLNSGIRDAANLCWKLAAVIGGGLAPEVLATYERERRPHAAAVVASSARLGRVVMTTSSRLARFRDDAIRRALADPERRVFFERMRFRPESRLREGMVVPADDRHIGRMVGQPRAFSMETRRVELLDAPLGTGWALLGIGLADRAWARVRVIAGSLGARMVDVALDDRLPASRRVVIVDVDGGLEREFGALRGRFVLLRPDRYVAAVWSPGEDNHVAAVLSRWLHPDRSRSAQPEEENHVQTSTSRVAGG